jgi:biopolymer transport protein ExbD
MPLPRQKVNWSILGIALATSACATGVVETPAAAAAAPSPTPAASVPVTTLDLPKAREWTGIQVILSVEMHLNGDLVVDGVKLDSDEELPGIARRAVAKNSELRAVIKADQAILYGKVIHVLDLLKQGGVAKIAFAVQAPQAGEGGGTEGGAEDGAIEGGSGAGGDAH